MNKLNVGDYVRYEYENIIYLGKIDFISEVMCGLDETLEIEIDNCVEPILKKQIIKSSPNIIDLIEVGDFITYKQGNFYWGIPERVSGRYNRENQLTQLIVDEKPLNTVEILTVVTHEQFENISYKVGE